MSLITDNEKIMNLKLLFYQELGLSPKAMEKLKKIRQNYIKCSQNKKIIIGICLGLQLLERSYENKLTKG